MGDPAETSEIDRLRAELEQSRAMLAATESECEILRRELAARSAGALAGGRSPRAGAPLQIGSRERMAMLEHTVDVLEGFALSRASWDCYGCDWNRGRRDSNTEQMCEPCEARYAIERVKAYRFGGSTETPSRRFVGAMHRRVESGWDPRETKIHRAWAGFHGHADRSLAMILTDRASVGPSMFEGPLDWPMARDWYVATSVVQWLATNVGSSILEKAGWRYTQHDEDRAAIDAKRAERTG